MNTALDHVRPAEVLLTGAAGFVGSHLLARLLRDTDWIIHCPVSFRHHGNPERVTQVVTDARDDGVEDAWERVHLAPCDLALPLGPTILASWSRCRYVFNVASSSHVDRSIIEPGSFVLNNVALMTNVLDAARRMPDLRIFLQMSTDEVYGPAAGDYRHVEWDTILPSNPYSASKAAQEAIAFAYWRTYDLPLIITNTMNIIGERQDPEKFLPTVIRRLLNCEKIEVHSSATGESGSRYYLHADNLADAWLHLVLHYEGVATLPRYRDGAHRPARFHIVGEREIKNDDLVKLVARVLKDLHAIDGFSRYDAEAYAERLIERVNFHSARPGHDLRYALDGWKMDSIGWRQPVTLDESIRATVRWYLANTEWLKEFA
jgi:dTDP-glucose 4,6-dehydratase